MKKILPLLLIGLLFLVIGPVFSKARASYLILNPPFGDVAEGKNLSVDLVLHGEEELVDGVDILLDYDVNRLAVKSIKEGPFFSKYPIKKDEKGKIRLTALAPKEGVKIFGDIIVATVDFTILDNGKVNLKYEYSKNATNDSNAPLHGVVSDTLRSASGGSYTVKATPEQLRQTQAKKKKGGLSPLPIFILLLIAAGVGVWYYLKKRKPKEDVFVPEPFPLDRPPTSQDDKTPKVFGG